MEGANINNLKSIRKNRKVKVAELAELLNVTEQFYYLLENSQRTLSQEYLEKLADFYNVTIDYLLGRTDHKNGIILSGDSLPQELKEVGYEEIELIKDAEASGLTFDDIKNAIEFAKKLKGK